jgi:hypothetical protein
MSIAVEIQKQLVDPEKHGPILKALVDILEEQGEKGVKERIKKWVEEITQESDLPPSESEA